LPHSDRGKAFAMRIESGCRPRRGRPRSPESKSDPRILQANNRGQRQMHESDCAVSRDGGSISLTLQNKDGRLSRARASDGAIRLALRFPDRRVGRGSPGRRGNSMISAVLWHTSRKSRTMRFWPRSPKSTTTLFLRPLATTIPLPNFSWNTWSPSEIGTGLALALKAEFMVSPSCRRCVRDIYFFSKGTDGLASRSDRSGDQARRR
jgi:hypothetical protein